MLPLLLQAALPALLIGLLLLARGASAGLSASLSLLAALLCGGLAWILGRRQRAELERLTASVRALSDTGRPLAVDALPDPAAELARSIAAMDARWTERVEALTFERERLLAALDGMEEGVWLTDAKGNITRTNRALKGLLAASERVEGEPPLALVRSEALHQAVLRACSDGASEQLELQLEGPRPRALSIRVTPLGSELSGSAAVFRDVSELRRLETVRTDFVANVSHELRTPITAIRGYAETLLSGALQDAGVAPKMVDIIHRQSERLSALVEDLLELSRLESRQQPLAGQEVHLSEVAMRASEAVRMKAEAKGLGLTLSVPASLTALADPRAVEQVLVNLLDNAVKYTPEGGRVELLGAEADGRCLLHIRDSGVGIEAKHLPRIFERFYRVDKGRSRDLGGTGLGLSIVKHLLGGMEGEIRVESTPNHGSTFTVSLRSARAEAIRG